MAERILAVIRRTELLWMLVLVACLLIWAAVSLVAIAGPSIGAWQGARNPVLATPLQVDRVVLQGAHVVVLAGWGVKSEARSACVFRPGSMEWYNGRPGAAVWKDSQFRELPRQRGAGRTEWQAIQVEMTLAAFRAGAFATVQHDCPGVPWPVTSLFYQTASDGGSGVVIRGKLADG